MNSNMYLEVRCTATHMGVLPNQPSSCICIACVYNHVSMRKSQGCDDHHRAYKQVFAYSLALFGGRANAVFEF